MPRRAATAISSLETQILEYGIASEQFYGFALAKALAEGASALIAHGTLYRALGRMTGTGLLSVEWEGQAAADLEGRPRRRLYTVTGEGARALSAARATPLPSAKVSLA